jgi:hypothetical protein
MTSPAVWLGRYVQNIRRINPTHGRKSSFILIFYPGHRSRKKDKMVSHSATEKSTGLSGVGGILRQAQTQSLRPPTLRLCTSLKFSKIVPDRVDEGKTGECNRRGKSYKIGRELHYRQHRIMPYPKKNIKALLLH